MLVKICGFTRKKDIADCRKLGIDFFGFNFYRRSKRYLAPRTAEKILNVSGIETKKIGVFVNPGIKEIGNKIKRYNLSGIQLSGDETPGFCRTVRKNFPDKLLIKAFRIKERPPSNLQKYSVDYFIFDASYKKEFGGTGRTFNWTLLKRLKNKKIKFFIAGGISPANIKELLNVIRPAGIDIASGVETKPGIKNTAEVKKLLKAVKEYQQKNI